MGNFESILVAFTTFHFNNTVSLTVDDANMSVIVHSLVEQSIYENLHYCDRHIRFSKSWFGQNQGTVLGFRMQVGSLAGSQAGTKLF